MRSARIKFSVRITLMCYFIATISLFLNHSRCSSNQLTGSLPSVAFDQLGSLVVCCLPFNEIGGGIPESISSKTIVVLNLQSNKLTGNIPASLSTCTNLRVLHL